MGRAQSVGRSLSIYGAKDRHSFRFDIESYFGSAAAPFGRALSFARMVRHGWKPCPSTVLQKSVVQRCHLRLGFPFRLRGVASVRQGRQST
jgi:hypothetical protein